MHNLAPNPAATSQHLPEGWAFPTATLTPVPMPIANGVEATTVTQIRWGRIVLMLAGVLLAGLGAWTLFDGGVATAAKPRVANADTSGDGIGLPDRSVGMTAPVTKTPAATKPRSKPAAPSTTKSRAAATTAIATGGGALSIPDTAAAVAPQTVTGGGASAPAELPLTGIESWIAAFLGLVLLGVGICVHVNAVRIGMTAMLYRRGILLRPVDCARLAQERGLPRVRVLLSNLLHRLLEEPTTSGDFVSTRRSLSR